MNPIGNRRSGAAAGHCSLRACRFGAMAGIGGAVLMQGALLVLGFVLLGEGLGDPAMLATPLAAAALGVVLMLFGRRLARRATAEGAAPDRMPLRLVADAGAKRGGPSRTAA